jgi:hypothetical protein
MIVDEQLDYRPDCVGETDMVGAMMGGCMSTCRDDYSDGFWLEGMLTISTVVLFSFNLGRRENEYLLTWLEYSAFRGSNFVVLCWIAAHTFCFLFFFFSK